MAIHEQLKKIILDTLPGVECVIGWGPGQDALHGSPVFMRKPEDVDSFMDTPLGAFGAVNNLALFLPELSGKKVGVVVKGCDSRSIVQLVAEKLIKREEVVIIGFPCEGAADLTKIEKALPEGREAGEVTGAAIVGETLKLSLGSEEISLGLADIKADKCTRCKTPGAVISDAFAGIAGKAPEVRDEYADLAALEAMSLDERFKFWEREMSRCIRCYACRNACPLCVCRDHCVAGSRSPHWITQTDSTRDKLMFQIIHATHLAGRCTGCGECQRACPAGIPVLLLKRTFNRGVAEIFGYDAGMDTEATPPLLTFQVEEAHIKEREWQ
ncbi:MAG: 4Fe-4S dicluster domain-containing protein [Deltaproteobacteria bacterium]|nr:4Fe-4S dicluster domain-containing protein [Deltaproteobacteria bacterium]